ncbi:MAG: 50S ribosomal protein L31e [archaeon]|nr:50S ribosomal protein L31e [archaeon]
MADENTRTMTIPLRGAKQAPRSRRTERAVKDVRAFVMRHMKADAEHVWLDKSVNEKLWENGIRNPPSKIIVDATKFDDGLVEVILHTEPKASEAKE